MVRQHHREVALAVDELTWWAIDESLEGDAINERSWPPTLPVWATFL